MLDLVLRSVLVIAAFVSLGTCTWCAHSHHHDHHDDHDHNDDHHDDHHHDHC
jgi:hypothetical protein